MAYTPQQIQQYAVGNGWADWNGNISNPQAIYGAAQQYGVSADQLDQAGMWAPGTAAGWAAQNGQAPLTGGAQPQSLAPPTSPLAAEAYQPSPGIGTSIGTMTSKPSPYGTPNGTSMGGAPTGAASNPYMQQQTPSGYVNPQGQGGYPPGYNAGNAPMYQQGQSQYGYGYGPNSSNRGMYEQRTDAGSFAAADQQQAGAYGANAYNTNNSYIGRTSQGINGAPSVMGYAEKAQYNNPYLGQNADRSQGAGKNAYAGENKYLQSAIDKSAGDMTRNFNNSVVPQLDRMAQQSGSFGNSGVQQMQGEAYRNLGENIGNMSSNMRFQDYTTQQGLAEADLNRGQQNNQFNSGLSQNDIGRNLAGGYQGNAQNNGYFMDAAKFDASNNLNTQQFNSSLGNNDLTRNSNLMQGQEQFNTGALNTNSMFNAGANNQNSMFNAGQGNNLNQYNAGSANNMIQNQLNRNQNQGQFDSTLANNRYQYDSSLANNQNQFGQNLASNNRQFDATLGQNQYQFDQNLDRGIWNDNMGWANTGFNNTRGLMQDAYNYGGAGVQNTTNEQNTPLNYLNQFSTMANNAGGLGGQAVQQYDAQGNPILGAVGGWNMFAPKP